MTGAGRPGVVREAALAATASDLAKDGTLKDSLGDALSGHALAQARKLRGQRARERGHRRQRHRRQGSRQQQQQGDGTAAALSAVGPGDHDVDTAEGSGCANGAGGGGDPGDWNWNEKGGSVTEQMERAEATAGGGSGRGWEEDTFEYDGRLGEEGQGGGADTREGGGADVVRVPCFYVVNLSPVSPNDQKPGSRMCVPSSHPMKNHGGGLERHLRPPPVTSTLEPIGGGLPSRPAETRPQTSHQEKTAVPEHRSPSLLTLLPRNVQ